MSFIILQSVTTSNKAGDDIQVNKSAVNYFRDARPGQTGCTHVHVHGLTTISANDKLSRLRSALPHCIEMERHDMLTKESRTAESVFVNPLQIATVMRGKDIWKIKFRDGDELHVMAMANSTHYNVLTAMP